MHTQKKKKKKKRGRFPEPPIAIPHSLQTLLFLSRHTGLPFKSREENV
jgi:hypothetical protein